MPAEVCKIIICSDGLAASCSSGARLAEEFDKHPDLAKKWIEDATKAQTAMSATLEQLRLRS